MWYGKDHEINGSYLYIKIEIFVAKNFHVFLLRTLATTANYFHCEIFLIDSNDKWNSHINPYDSYIEGTFPGVGNPNACPPLCIPS